MTRNIFGWSYPPGAENDPNAPYNQPDNPCEEIPLNVFNIFEKYSDEINSVELWNKLYKDERDLLRIYYKDKEKRLRADWFSEDVDIYNTVYNSNPSEPYFD